MPSSPPSRTARIAPHELWLGVRKTITSDAFGGALLILATAIALILANSPASDWYQQLREFRFGPEALHLNLSLSEWASDALLAVFFFVVGLELKEEFVVGRLRDPRKAALPIAAACGGVVVPAALYLLVNLGSDPAAQHGWAIPTATDIAFSVAVLAVVGRRLPSALRVFLLTLAIVDDLIAIVIIAIVYTTELQLGWLALALLPLGVFAILVRRGVRSIWLLLPLAALTWFMIHSSGIHATIAGVLLGFTVPVVATPRARVQVGIDEDQNPVFDGLAAHFADRWEVVTVLFAVPIFAFFSAGVSIGGIAGLQAALTDPITFGIVLGLVVGKPLGILSVTFLLSRSPAFRLDPALRWPELTGLAFVAGIGFTVSLLVGKLAFGADSAADDHVTIGVLTGSFIAAVIGAVILGIRGRRAAAS